MATDYYELLGVTRHATDDEIKKAYRRLARELHPDLNPGDKSSEDRFKQVTVAYETLCDPERRRRYDMFGPEGVQAPTDPFSTMAGAGIGDLFDAFFGGASPFGGGRQRGYGGPPRGSDAELALDLSFEEAVFGVAKDVSLRANVTCGTCGGSGARPGTTPTRCGNCRGSGEVRRVRQSILGQMVTATPVDDGSTLRLTGRGHAGGRGGPPGDLYVHLRVRPHDRFTRAGYDLVHVLRLPVTQAALGAHLAFETLDGTEDLVVPAGTQTGRMFRLRDRGVPRVDGRGRGDLVVQVEVETPVGLTKAQEALLRQLSEERSEAVAPEDTGLLAKIRSAFK